MWYVYFLHLDNGDIYVGSTNDLRRRVASHQRGQVNSTEGHLPVTLKSYVAVWKGLCQEAILALTSSPPTVRAS